MTQTSDHFLPIPLDRALEAGARIGPFRVLHVIERGVRATSYAAAWVEGDKDVTLRVYAPELCRDAARTLRFVKSQQALSQRRLSGVPRLVDHGQLDDGRLWIAIERLRGATLADRLLASTVARDAADRLIAQLASVLVAAHELSVFHGDLRIDDVFVVERETSPAELCLLDLGASSLLGGTSSGLRESAAADVRNLGKIAFRLWVGRELDEGKDLMPHPAGQPRFAGVGTDEERFLLALLSPSAQLRPSMAEVLAWLNATGDARSTAPWGVPKLDPPTREDGPAAEPTPPTAAPRRRRWWLALPAIAALACGLLLVARHHVPTPTTPRAAAVQPRALEAPPLPAARPPAAATEAILEIAERHARVLVDGVAREVVDGRVRVDGIGPHHVRVTARNRAPFDREVRVEPGQSLHLVVSLQHKQVSRDLNYLVDPFGAAAAR